MARRTALLCCRCASPELPGLLAFRDSRGNRVVVVFREVPFAELPGLEIVLEDHRLSVVEDLLCREMTSAPFGRLGAVRPIGSDGQGAQSTTRRR